MILEVSIIKLLFFIFMGVSFSTFSANILELNPELALNEVPAGTKIIVKLPRDFKDRPFPFAGGDMYSTDLYFEDGKLKILQDKVKEGTNIIHPAKKPSANVVLCRLNLNQWGSSKFTLTGDTLVLTVMSSNRNDYFLSLDGKPNFSVLDTSAPASKENSVSFPSINCKSGYLKGLFIGLTVGKFTEAFGTHLEGKKNKKQKTGIFLNSKIREEAVSTSKQKAIKGYQQNVDQTPLGQTISQ